MSTAIGRMYARLVNSGRKVWPTDIQEKYLQETYDAYVEYGFEPEIEIP
jgi:uncharacterized UPF0146 family protein